MKTEVERKQESDLRLIERNERGPAGQLVILDQRLGKGVGAEKERKRLMAQLTPEARRRYLGLPKKKKS